MNFVRINFKKNIYIDAYTLPMRKNSDCCGVVDNGCIHYGFYTCISGQGGYLAKYCCDPNAGRLFKGFFLLKSN